MDDVYRTSRNRVAGLDLDRFQNDASATCSSSEWNDLDAADKAERRIGRLRRAVDMVQFNWNGNERFIWKMFYDLEASTTFIAGILGVTPRTIQAMLKGLRDDVTKGIEAISRSVDGVQGPPQQRRKNRARRITRSEALARIKLPGHERELAWLRGGSWIDLTDRTCRSNPVRRPFTAQERAEYRDPTPGMPAVRSLVGGD